MTGGWLPSADCRRVLATFPGTATRPRRGQCAELTLTSPSGGDQPGAPVSCADPRTGRHQLAGLVAWDDTTGDQGPVKVLTRLRPFYRWLERRVTRYFRYHHPYFGELQE